MNLKNYSKDKYLKDDLVIYSYCYPDAVENTKLRQENQLLKGIDITPGYIKTKVGDTTQGLDEGLTIDESGKLRMSQQGGTGESDKKIVVGTWGVSKNNIKRDFAIHNELKKRGLRPAKDKDGKPILDGQGNEFFLIPGNTVEEVNLYLQDVIVSFGASANEKLRLREAQNRIINERLENYNSSNSQRVDHVSNLCPRFGKTTEELHYFNKINKKIMMGPSAVLSTHTSFKDDIARFRDFEDIEYITTHENPDYEKDIKKAFSQGKRVFVTVSLFSKNKKYFKFLRDIPNGDKYICIDEGDFAAWTPKKREVLEYLIPNNNTGKFCVNTMSGTNMPRMVTGANSVDGVFTATYMELEQSEDNIIKRCALKMTLSDTDEYVKELTKEDYFSWTKFWANPYKSENFAVNFMEGTLSESEDDNLNYKNLALSNPMKQTVNCIMMFGSGGMKEMDAFKKICLKSEKLKKHYNFVVLHSGHTTNAKAQDYVREQINLTKREGKRGLIIISNTMGSRSFSISEIQATLICYDKGGEDPTQQRASRPLTPGKLWDGETDKKLGYIVTYSMDSNRDILITNLLSVEAAQYSTTKNVSIQKANRILTNNVSILCIGKLGNVIKIEPDELLEEMSSSKILSKVAFALSKPEKILNDPELLDKILSMTVGKSKSSKKDTQLPKAKNFITDTKGKKLNKKQKNTLNEVIKKIDMLCATSSMVAALAKGKTYRACLNNIDSVKFERRFGIDKQSVIKTLDIGALPEIRLDAVVASTSNIIKSGDINKFQELETIGIFPELGIVKSTEKELWIRELKQIKNINKLKIASVGTNMGHEVSALLELGVSKENITVIDKGGFPQVWKSAGINVIEKPIEEINKMKFDLIIGNPPYQQTTVTGSTSNHKLWVRFLDWATKIADQVAFITPKSASILLNGLELNQVKLNSDMNVAYYNGYDVDKHFNVGSTFCYFLLTKKDVDSMLVNCNGTVEAWTPGSHIPFDNINKTVSNIISKTMNFKNDYGRSAARVAETTKGKYDDIRYIKKAGAERVKSNGEHKDRNKPKMLYPTLGPGEFLDVEGEIMPTTSHTVYITTNTKEELKELIKIQNSTIFQFLQSCFKSMRSPRDYVWKNLKKGDFKLTEKEMDYINKHVG